VNDILLTPEAIKAIIGKYWQEHGTYDGVDEVLCRAQVRKVVEWLEKRNQANDYPVHCDAVTQHSFALMPVTLGAVVLGRDDVQALRAAGGGR